MGISLSVKKTNKKCPFVIKMCRDRNFVFRQAAYICILMRTDLTQQCCKIMEIWLIPHIYYVMYFHIWILIPYILGFIYLKYTSLFEILIQNNVRKNFAFCWITEHKTTFWSDGWLGVFAWMPRRRKVLCWVKVNTWMKQGPTGMEKFCKYHWLDWFSVTTWIWWWRKFDSDVHFGFMMTGSDAELKAVCCSLFVCFPFFLILRNVSTLTPDPNISPTAGL